MNFVLAESKDLEEIYNLVQKTIKIIYVKYYASGVVDFFCKHHSLENIKTDIVEKNIFVVKDSGKIIATGTVKENNINRFFVNPDFQGRGIGTEMLDFLEGQIFPEYDCVKLHSSLAAVIFYEKRGYTTISHESTDCENGCVLCYEIMKKDFKRDVSLSST